MLNIILGEKDKDKYLKDVKFVDYNDGFFNKRYKPEWFEDKFIQNVLETIDNIDLSQSSCVTFKNKITGDLHSHEKLSTGCKTTVLIYKFPEVVFRARFGDNCCDFIEKIASKQDITLYSGYLHSFKLRYVDKINYLNYNQIVTKPAEIWLDLADKFRKDNLVESTRIDETDMDIDELRIRHPRFFVKLEAMGL